MPIINGKYINPNWHDDFSPAKSAQELQDLCDTLENVHFPELIVRYADSGTIVIATNGSDTVTLTESSGIWKGHLTGYGTWTVSGVVGGAPYSTVINVDTVKQYNVSFIPSDINNASWAIIGAIGQEGKGADFWSIGDMKSVYINGAIGSFLTVDTTIYVYIIGINHQDIYGITFGFCKQNPSESKTYALVDGGYKSSSSNKAKYFNINHGGNYNYGGWKGCDMRYDILGSTDIAPSNYPNSPNINRTGYDATSTTATSPVANTLMAALPADLRAVIRPMVIYTDNRGNSGNTQDNITTSVDYLPLLAEFEVFGSRSYANQYEKNYQAQYAYYIAGNSKVKYRHNETATTNTSQWYLRSPYFSNNTAFVRVYENGTVGAVTVYSIYGLSPMFTV